MTEPRGNLLDVMGDQHQSRRIGVGGQIGQAGDQILPATEVQAGGGLVEQQKFGIGHQRPRDQHPLAFALRERAIGAVRQVLGADALESVHRTQIIHVVVTLAPTAQHRVAGRNHQIPNQFIVRNPLRQCRTAQSNPLTQFGHIHPAEPLPQDHRHTRGRVFHGGGHPQQRGLAGAVGTDHHPAFIELDLPVDRPDQHPAAAPQRHTAEVDQQIIIDHRVVLRVSHSLIVPYPHPR